MDFIKDYTLFLEKEIENIKFPSDPSNLYNPLTYFLTLGGKRMRPMATLIAGDLFGAEIEEIELGCGSQRANSPRYVGRSVGKELFRGSLDWRRHMALLTMDGCNHPFLPCC
jgi:geranylgeranyl pyrophosphate synthase